jgi:uncharacterized membrane protein
MIKKSFKTGLAILLPVLFTFLILGFFINLLTKPFLHATESFLASYSLFNHPFLFLQDHEVLRIASKCVILIFLLVSIGLVGCLGRLFLITYLFKWGDAFLHRMPVINRIYKTCQDIIHTLFSPTSKSFSQVVFVPFPSSQSISVGLVTRDTVNICLNQSTCEVIPVFVPGTPNPSVGFMLMFKKEELIFVDMTVEQALKFVVSCGVVMPNFTISPHLSIKHRTA